MGKTKEQWKCLKFKDTQCPNFRKGKSIDTAIQSFIGRIQKALDKRVHTIGIFTDLTKAYDVVIHSFIHFNFHISIYR